MSADAVSRLRANLPYVVFVDIAASAGALEAEERAVPRLSPADVQRIEAFKDERKRAWRASRIALRIVLERFVEPEQIRGVDLAIAPGGRPHLETGPHFSVSHTDGALLIAVAERPVGVDIESVRPLRLSDERRSRMVAAAQRFAPSSDIEMSDVEAWVQLEAVAKARGSGIGVLLTEEGVVGGTERRGTHAGDIVVRPVPLDERYVAAIASETLPKVIDVTAMPPNVEGLEAFQTAGRRPPK